MADKHTSERIDRALDAELDLYRVAPPSIALESRLLELAPSVPPPARTGQAPRRGWLNGLLSPLFAGGSAAVASALIGAVVGYQALTAAVIDDEASAFLTASSADWTSDIWTGTDG